MGKPKKLSYAERLQKKEANEIRERLHIHHQDLNKIYKAMKTSAPDTFDTWRWAALEVFKTLQKDFPQNNTDVKLEKARALAIAREAQAIIHFFG